jgi:hypothetical protein
MSVLRNVEETFLGIIWKVFAENGSPELVRRGSIMNFDGSQELRIMDGTDFSKVEDGAVGFRWNMLSEWGHLTRENVKVIFRQGEGERRLFFRR